MFSREGMNTSKKLIKDQMVMGLTIKDESSRFLSYRKNTFRTGEVEVMNLIQSFGCRASFIKFQIQVIFQTGHPSQGPNQHDIHDLFETEARCKLCHTTTRTNIHTVNILYFHIGCLPSSIY